MGNASHVSSGINHTHEIRAEKFLTQCSVLLKKIKSEHKTYDVDDTIEYIKQKEVRKQFAKIIGLFPKINPIQMSISLVHDVFLMEAILINSKGEEYRVVFWPLNNQPLSIQCFSHDFSACGLSTNRFVVG
jgi:hypothetical protein